MSNPFVSLQYMDPDNMSILARRADGSARYMQPGEDWWSLAMGGALGDIAAYEPPPEPRRAPRVTRFQIRAALLGLDLLDAAETAAQEAGGVTLIAWQEAAEYPRGSSAIASITASIGLSDEEVDDLFSAAAEIAV